MIDKMVLYFQYPFVRYALIVGVLIALCSSLLGVTLVLKGFSYIGDGLSHVAFGAMAVATILHFSNNMFFILPVTMVCAVALLRTGQNTRIRGDAAIGEVILCCILSALVVIAFVLFYHKIFCVTFDEIFAKATGMNTDFYNLMIAVITAVIIVLAMNLVGSLLISALVIFPALSAMRIFKSFFGVTVCSVVLSVVCAVIGILLAILAGTPVGSTIVAADIFAFIISCAIGKIAGR